MNEFVTEDIKTLIKHINTIAIKRQLPYVVSVQHDLINHKSKESIELRYNYMFHSKDEDSKIIISSGITVPYDQYLDEKEKIVYWANQYLYQEILIHTSFEPELNNKNDKYKWN